MWINIHEFLIHSAPPCAFQVDPGPRFNPALRRPGGFGSLATLTGSTG